MDQRQRAARGSETVSVCGESCIGPGVGRVSAGGGNVKENPGFIEIARYHAHGASGKSNFSSTARIIRDEEGDR
jgi:hypothetical protein